MEENPMQPTAPKNKMVITQCLMKIPLLKARPRRAKKKITTTRNRGVHTLL